MAKTRMSTRGRVTIPKSVRDALDLRPGMTFEIEMFKNGLSLRLSPRLARSPLADVAGCLEWRKLPISVEAMDAAVAGEAQRKASD